LKPGFERQQSIGPFSSTSKKKIHSSIVGHLRRSMLVLAADGCLLYRNRLLLQLYLVVRIKPKLNSRDKRERA